MLKDRSQLVAQIKNKNLVHREMVQELAAAYDKIEDLEKKLAKAKAPVKKPRTYTKKSSYTKPTK
jgi:predicted S18 family serine protease